MCGRFSPCLCVILVFVLLLGKTLGQDFTKDEKIYTNGWAIRVHGGLEEAKKIAKAHGFEDVHPVSEFTVTNKNTLIFTK